VSATGANPMWRSFLRGNEPQATDLAKNVARRRRLSPPEHIPFVKRSKIDDNIILYFS